MPKYPVHGIAYKLAPGCIWRTPFFSGEKALHARPVMFDEHEEIEFQLAIRQSPPGTVFKECFAEKAAGKRAIPYTSPKGRKVAITI
jgi:hypothetical protein